jgi:hypothetical protein
VLRDLSEEDLVVVLALGVDRLAGFGCSQEVDSLASQFELLTIGDEEFRGSIAVLVLDFTLVGDLVLGLVVDEHVGRTLTVHPVVKVFSLALANEDTVGHVLTDSEGFSDKRIHPIRSVRHSHILYLI